MSLKVRPLELPELLEITPQRYEDSRGFFTESYNHERFVAQGIDCEWVQDNHSYSKQGFTLRGLHFQRPPHAQTKLVRVITGSVFDVAVDIREGSPTYGKWAGLVLSAELGNQLLIPKGFAHGFLTLEPDVHICYKVTAPYSAEHERSIRFDDKDIDIFWPLGDGEPLLSEKDYKGGSFSQTVTGFCI